MHKVSWTGLALAALGLIGLIYSGVTQDSSGGVAHMGSVQLPIDGQRWMPLSPIGGVMTAVLGFCLVFGDRMRRRTCT